MAQRLWNGPVAHALLPRRQHDLARIKNFDAGGALHGGSEQSACRGRDLNDLAAIAHGNTHDAPEPEQIFGPKLARDQVEISPILLAEPRLVPGLVGQARDIEIGAGVILRAAQRLHAGISEPWPFPPLLGFVQTRMLVTCERISPNAVAMPDWPAPTTSTSSAGLPSGPRRGRKPRRMRMRDLGEIGTNLGFESDQSAAHAASQPPSTTITVPVVKEDASLARCSAASATSSALPNRFMAWRLRDASRTGSGSA